MVAPALTEPSVATEFLSSQSGTSWLIVSAIATSLPPGAVPNDYRTDPWLLAADAVARADRTSVPVYLAAYLLTRALGSRSRSSGELARLSFEQVHEAARSNQLP